MEILEKAKNLKLNMKIVRKILVDFIRKETTRFGLKKESSAFLEVLTQPFRLTFLLKHLDLKMSSV